MWTHICSTIMIIAGFITTTNIKIVSRYGTSTAVTLSLFHERNIRLLTTGHWKVGGAVEKVHSQVNIEAGIYMQEPCDGSAAGSLASPAWNSTHE